jgi:hypothetical protein
MVRHNSISELGDKWSHLVFGNGKIFEFGLGDQFSKYIMDVEEIQKIQLAAFRTSATMQSLIYSVPRIRVRALENTNSENAKNDTAEIHILGMLAAFGCLLAILIGCLI